MVVVPKAEILNHPWMRTVKIMYLKNEILCNCKLRVHEGETSMQRRKSAVVCALLITLLITIPTGGITLGHIRLNDAMVELEYPLTMENGRTLVALEDLVRALTLEVAREADKIVLGGKDTSFKLSLKDGDELGTRSIEGTLYVPLRFVAESFGATVSWRPKTRSIFVTTETAATLESSPEHEILKRGDLQSDSKLSSWFDRNHRNQGVYSTTIEDDTYVLVSAGPKPTGGFGLELESVVLTEPGSLLVTVHLTSPKPGDMVTMAFTYPNIILQFSNQTFEKVDMALNEPSES